MSQDLLDITPARARLDGQRFFLTYSQVPEDFDGSVLLVDLDLLNPTWVEAIAEQHQDGGTHWHAVVVFPRRFQRNMSAFDSQGVHPNIQSIRNGTTDLFRCRHYIRKGDKETHGPSHEDNPCDYTAEPIYIGRVPPYSIPVTRLTWGEILTRSQDVENFLANVKEHYPRDFVLRHDAVLSYAQTYYSRPDHWVPEFTQDQFFVPDELNEWVADVLHAVSRIHSHES